MAEWRAYEQLEPFGDWRADWRTALLAALSYNANRGPREPAREIDEFMPVFDAVMRQRRKDHKMMSRLQNLKPKTMD